MAIDYSKPVNTDAATGVLLQLRENINSVLTQTQGTGANIPTNSIRINPSTSLIESYNGSIWSRFGSTLTHFSASSTGGSANAHTATFTPVPSALVAGSVYYLTAGFTNTGATTLNPNSIGATSIISNKTGLALTGGEIISGRVYQLIYNGSTFSLMNPSDETGWTAVNETWTWASATTITVPTDATTRFQKGDKLRFTNSTVKYFYVVAVSATILTITGGSDYTFTNTTVSNISFSRAESPFGFPTWFNYAPTVAGFGTPPTAIYRFKIDGTTVSVASVVTAYTNSNATNYTVSAPVTSKTIASYSWFGYISYFQNNGAVSLESGLIQINSASATLLLYPTMSGGNWTNINGKGANFNLSYEI